MDDEQLAMPEQYPSITVGDDADGASQNALWTVTRIMGAEVNTGNHQSDCRDDTPNGGSLSAPDLSTLDLRLIDLADQSAPSPLRPVATEGRVIAGPWRIDGLAPALPLAASIVEAVPTALVVLDANLCVREANPAFYETFQVVPAETEQHDFFELGSGQWDIPWLRASLVQLLDFDSRLQDAEVEQVFPEIGPRTMRLQARRLAGPGADNLILLAIEDITERKAAEQQRQEFVLLLAHELRNPLTAITAYAQRMQEHKGSAEAALAIIVAQARHLNRMVDDLLDGSSQGAERLRLEPRLMDLADLVCMSVQQAQLLESRHAIRLELPEGPINGLWDSVRLTQVFANLLSNASKYSLAGSEMVVRVEDLGTLAQVSVQDRGFGIAAEELPKVFDRFYRVAATAHHARGLGIGLHVARMLVEAHGGSITAESVPDLGSTFRVTLPLGPSDRRTQ